MCVFIEAKEEGEKKGDTPLPYHSYPNSLCTEKLSKQVKV